MNCEGDALGFQGREIPQRALSLLLHNYKQQFYEKCMCTFSGIQTAQKILILEFPKC